MATSTATAALSNAGSSRSSKIASPAASVIPQGVGAPPPPGLDPKKGKLMCIKVRMLDDTVGVFHLGHRALGQALFEEVCRHLNLLECDYFGLEYLDCYGNSCWLDKEKPILKQITAARSDARFYFVVKFYTPTPDDLEEEYTRYLFALQIKRDLSIGHFVCNENTAALMASYIVQAECGDFSSDDYFDHSYLSPVRFIPNQSADFEKKVMDNHKQLIGMSPAEADLVLLETARRSEFYGAKFHACKDVEGTPVNIAVLHLGIKVYHQLSCANTFSWAKVRKLSFKRKKLFVKLHPENYAYYKDTVEFAFETRNECKTFWKKCVEHHAFFRCVEVIPLRRHQSKFFTKGSSFRYSGRTQKQLIDYVREHQKRREPFTRPIRSSMIRKVLSDERLLPTPVPSEGGTLVRQNGNLSTSVGPSAYLRQSDAITSDDVEHAVGYASMKPDSEMDRSRSQLLSKDAHKEPYAHQPTALANGLASSDDICSSSGSKGLHRISDAAETEDGLHSQRSISSPLRKGLRLHSIESSSSGQLTLADSLQQLPPTATSTARSNASGMTGISYRTPTANQQDTSFGSTFTASSGTNHNYENLEAYSFENRSSIEEVASGLGTLTSNMSSIERNIPVRLLYTSTDRSLASSNQDTNDKRAAKRYAYSSKPFCITKELLMTERTYTRDLSIIAKRFKLAMSPFCENVARLQQHSQTPQTRHKTENTFQDGQEWAFIINDVLTTFESLCDNHENLNHEIERRYNAWENKLNQQTPQSPSSNTPSPSDINVQKIGDLLLCGIHNSWQTYQHYVSRAMNYLVTLNDCYRSHRKFASACKDFEAQRVCYIPVNLLLLKPMRRLLAYDSILTRLTVHYIEEGGINPDLSDCKVAQEKLHTLINGTNGKSMLRQLENFAKLIQIERDLNDVQNLAVTTRTFIREGSLQRFTRKEPVQRLFLLFNDCLLYAGRSGASLISQQMTFRLHGQVPLRGLMLEHGDALKVATQGLEKCAFTIYGGNRSFVVATTSGEEKQTWLEDINRAVMEAKESKTDFPYVPSLKSASSTDDVSTAVSSPISPGSGTSTFKPSTTEMKAIPIDSEDTAAGALTAQSPTLSGERNLYYRASDTLHVCWHRMTTLGANQWYQSSLKGHMSGYLLRKFRTSNGWQKLWVVFCDFCLFFHKNHQDEPPLASLPLLGYTVTLPDAKDDMHKDYVFKLQYKAQYYFFRADSEFAYCRWLEALRVVCQDQCDR